MYFVMRCFTTFCVARLVKCMRMNQELLDEHMNFINRHCMCVASASPQPSSLDFLSRGCYKEIMYM